MYKKSFILVSVILFVLCIFSGFVSATNAVKGTVSNVTNTVVDGTANLANDIRSGVGNAENGIEDALKMDNVDNNNTDNNNNDNIVTNATRDDNIARTNDGDYTATRTTAGGAMTDNTSTMWVWLVVAIAAIVIIGLVWYYGTQNNTTHHDD